MQIDQNSPSPHLHGGDGDGDPPPPWVRGLGQHEEDAVPPKKGRGKAKNLELAKAWKANGKRPLTLKFDRDDTAATYTTTGRTHDLFIREIGNFIWRNISLDQTSWDNVKKDDKNSLFGHLKDFFDFEAVNASSDSSNCWAGIEHMIKQRYRGRKTLARKHFDQIGGYDDLERAMSNPPADMDPGNWEKVVQHFLSDAFKKRSNVNKVNKSKQVVKNRGGTH